MSSKIFKRTAIAASLLAVSQAHAALYRVVETMPAEGKIPSSQYTEAMGVAIQPGNLNNANNLGCFDSTATCDTNLGDNYYIAVETLMSDANGARYREEVPFGMDNAFTYISAATGSNSYESYCNDQLLYNSDYCTAWANNNYSIWGNEKANAGTSNGTVNAQILIYKSAGTSAVYNSVGNTVVNQLVGNAPTLTALVGNKSTYSEGLNLRNKAFSGINTGTVDTTPDTAFTYSDTSDGNIQSRAFEKITLNGGSTYTVGSASYKKSNDDGDDYYYSKPAIWNTTTVTALNWGDNNASDYNSSNDKYGEGSIRGITEDTSGTDTIYAVGYDTYTSNQYMSASVFSVPSTDVATPGDWTITEVSGAEANSDGTYSNSKLTAVNNNFVAIGEAKRSGSYPSDGAAANRMFLVSDVTASTPTATFFNNLGSIFFTGAGGEANAINNYNEIVGQVDAENSREIGGTPRRVRAFIYPYNGTNSDATRRDIFEDKAWWLDDLTNGNNGGSQNYSTENNYYRIINATGINDDGVISGTALKCSVGYSSTNDYASCNGTETTVAVKLVPIAGATSSNIDAREHSYPKTERKGGSVGWLGLSLLALLGLQRRRRT